MARGYRITVGTGLHKGDRDYQQDQLGVWSHVQFRSCVLGVVADGMGGRSGGRKASDQVLMTAQQLFERFSPDSDAAPGFLQKVVQEAHTVIQLTAVSAEQEPHSTIAAFLLMPDASCHWVHSGDSRVYHFRAGQLMHRTTDHSYVQTLVDKGLLTAQQANNHPQSNVLTGCLGAAATPPVGEHTIQAMVAEDALVACSDGVWHYFSDTEMARIVGQHSAKEACEALIKLARDRAQGHGDNLSVVVVKLDARD